MTDCWFLKRDKDNKADPESDKRRIVEFAGDLSESLLEKAK